MRGATSKNVVLGLLETITGDNMQSAIDESDTCVRVQRTAQRTVQRTPEFSASDFEAPGHPMWMDDGVNPDLDVGAALDRLDAIDEGRAETNPLRAAVDALGRVGDP